MVIPFLVVQLDEPDTAFGQAVRQQAIRGVRPWIPSILAIFPKNVVWLVGQIRHFGDGLLHAKGQFILLNSRFQFRIGSPLQLQFV